MNIFQPPPTTRYDLNFSIAGIPVRVHPLFWLLAAFFGASASDLLFLIIWIVVVFFSILIHELGHALAMMFFRQPSFIVLYHGGGLTVPESVRWGTGWADVSLERKQQILVILAGPGAGFLLAALVMFVVVAAGGSILVTTLLGIIPIPIAVLPFSNTILEILVRTLLWVNIFWGLINLVPVYPLDGGQIARHLWVGIDPLDGMRNSLWLSVGAGVFVAFIGLIAWSSVYLAFLFGYLAYQSYQALQGYI